VSEKPKRPYKRLTPATWAEIRASWETGETTLIELSTLHGVRTRTLQAHFDKHGTKKGAKAKEIAAAVEAEIYSTMTLDVHTRVQLGKETQAAAYQNAVAIERLLMTQVELAQKSPETAFKAAAAIKSLALAAQALERVSGIKRAALGLDQLPPSDEVLPVLQICDLSDQEIRDLRRREEEDEDGYEDEHEGGDREALKEAEEIKALGGRLVRSNCAG